MCSKLYKRCLEEITCLVPGVRTSPICILDESAQPHEPFSSAARELVRVNMLHSRVLSSPKSAGTARLQHRAALCADVSSSVPSTSGRNWNDALTLRRPSSHLPLAFRLRDWRALALGWQAQPEDKPPSNWPLPPAPLGLGSDRISRFDNLQGDDFRHPLDQQNTALLRSIPGLEMVAKNFMGPVAEQVLLLENVSTSLQIGPDQLPSVHRLLVEAAHVLRMEAPDLYVRQHPVPNAYTLAIAGRKPFVVVHTALLELLSPRELQAVLAHELGHLKCDHGLWLTVANVLAGGTVSMLPVISGVVEETLMRWLRAAELTCDRAALLVAQDAKVVVSALMKLAGGSPSFANELNVEAFLKQARSYEEATSSMLGWYLRNAQTRALSHPLPVMRAREVDRWSQSAQYKALLAKNRAYRTAGSMPVAGSARGMAVAASEITSDNGAGAPGSSAAATVAASNKPRPVPQWNGATAADWGQNRRQ